jgi:hypothetical protein
VGATIVKEPADVAGETAIRFHAGTVMPMLCVAVVSAAKAMELRATRTATAMSTRVI